MFREPQTMYFISIWLLQIKCKRGEGGILHQPVVTNEECLSYEDTKTAIANAFTIIFTIVIYHLTDSNNYEYTRSKTNVNLHFPPDVHIFLCW